MKKPSKRTSNSRATVKIPPGLESSPIAQQLQKMGLPVTRANWLMLATGSSSEEDLHGELVGFLDVHFPPED